MGSVKLSENLKLMALHIVAHMNEEKGTTGMYAVAFELEQEGRNLFLLQPNGPARQTRPRTT